MAINCSSNAALDTLNAKKDALNSKVAEMQSLGAGAMADLKAKADAMKDSLLAAVPVPPAIPNFKKELDELKGKVGKELTEAKAAFKERWGDALPDIDIDGLMDKVSAAKSLVDNFDENLNDLATGLVNKAKSSFDLCKDVPNIDAPVVSPEGKVEVVKVKAEEPIVAADIPEKVAPVVPTVVEKEKLPSVNIAVDTSAADIKRQKDLMNDELNEYRRYYKEKLSEIGSQLVRLQLQGSSNEPEWRSLGNGIIGTASVKSSVAGMTMVEYYNSGKPQKRIARSILRKWLIASTERDKFKEYVGQLNRFNMIVTYGTFLAGGYVGEAQSQEEYMNKRIILLKEEGDSLVETTPGGHDGVLVGYAEILVQHEAIIKDLRNYKA